MDSEDIGAFEAKTRLSELLDNVSLIASARYIHLSNAYIHGEKRNPSIDGFGGFGGINIDF